MLPGILWKVRLEEAGAGPIQFPEPFRCDPESAAEWYELSLTL